MAPRDETSPDTNARPVVRDYLIVSLAALLIITLILLEEGLHFWSVLPLMLGSIGLVSNWTLGPSLTLLSLMMLLILKRWLLSIPRWLPEEPAPLLHLALAGVTLIYAVSATRLLALVRHAVPPDTRRARKPPGSRARGRWLLPREGSARSSLAIPSTEIVVLLLSAPAFVLAAFLLWRRLANELPPTWLRLSMPLWQAMPLWRVLLLVWGGGIVLAAGYTLLSYLNRAQAGNEESLLFLQDQLWTETRGEQRRINRWIVWGRLRAQRKEEKA
jgi:hypothetical protein